MDEYPILDVKYYQSTQAIYLIENIEPTISIEIKKTSQPTLLHPSKSLFQANVYMQKAGQALPNYRYIDKNINSFFKEITIYHDNVIKQKSRNVARYLHLKDDITKDPSEIYGDSISKLGGEPYINTTLPTITTTLPDPYAADDYEATITDYEVFHNSLNNNTFFGFNPHSATTYRQVSFTLHNILGEQCDDLPLHLLKGDLRIELKCHSEKDIAFADTAGNRLVRIYLRDVFYKAYFTYITPQMSKELYPSNVHKFTAQCFHSEQFFVEAGTTNLFINLNNFRYKYAKNIYFFFSNPASQNTNTKIYLSQRIKANTHRFYIKHGNNNYPRKPIEGVAEMFEEVQKCSGNNKSLLTMKTYNLNANDDTTASDDLMTGTVIAYDDIKRYVGAISLLKYGGRPTNLTEHDLSLNIELRTITVDTYPLQETNFTTTENLELFVFLEYDCHYTIHNGDIIMDK